MAAGVAVLIVGAPLVAVEAPAAATPARAAQTEIIRVDPALDAVIAPGAVIEKIAGGFGFTEGPLWRNGELWFSDLTGAETA
jgi:gluconolactonase